MAIKLSLLNSALNTVVYCCKAKFRGNVLKILFIVEVLLGWRVSLGGPHSGLEFLIEYKRKMSVIIELKKKSKRKKKELRFIRIHLQGGI